MKKNGTEGAVVRHWDMTPCIKPVINPANTYIEPMVV